MTGRVLLDVCLPTPTSGLTVVLCWIRSLVPLHLGLVCMLICLVMIGGIVDGGTLMR